MVDNKDQVAATQHLLSKCREYILGLKMEIARKEMPKVKRKGRNVKIFLSFTDRVHLRSRREYVKWQLISLIVI